MSTRKYRYNILKLSSKILIITMNIVKSFHLKLIKQNMTDPFFQTAQNNWSNNNEKKNNQEWIQLLLEQQRQIQEKYKELKELYNHEKLTEDQKQELEEQIQKLTNLYKQNKDTLATLTTTIDGDKEIHTNTNVTIKKESNIKKLSFKWIAIWCCSILILLIWIFALIFFRVIKNPSSFNWIIPASTAILLTQTLCIIFFGLLFIISLWILIVNVYRLISIKNKNKIKEILGSLLWFILLILTLVIWSSVFSKLRWITPDSIISQNQIVTTYAVVAEKWETSKTVRIWSDPSLLLIAPINIIYEINVSLLQKQFISKYGDVSLRKLELDCGNWNGRTDISNSARWQCFFTSKWTKTPNLRVTFIKNQTQELSNTIITLAQENIVSEILLSTNQWQTQKLNSDIIVWKNPVKVTYDASSIFRDLSLQNYDIAWDPNADWVYEKEWYTTYTYNYTTAWVFHVNIRFPGINNYIYTFPIRIEQSDVPVAEIVYTNTNSSQYNIKATFPWEDPDIARYSFNIINKDTKSIIDTISTTEPSISYTFPWDWTYAIQLNFVTQEWKQWSAESDDIEIGWSKYQVLYDIQTKTTTSPSFTSLWNTENIILRELPTILRIDIQNITPKTATTEVTVSLNWKPIIWKNNVFSTTIEDSQNSTLTISISDKNHEDMSYKKSINISVKRDDIIPRLIITPDTVWTAPFEVTFDASTTTINAPDDEIIYFSRYFGDGNTELNTSQSIIKHTYQYDYQNENWEFHPTLTLKTKKWREISTDATILIKKPIENVSISLDSHPAQIASVWDKVTMSTAVNWTPSKITRDFWDWKTFECKGRECLDISNMYEKPGSYEIKVTISYENRPDVEWSINLVVK